MCCLLDTLMRFSPLFSYLGQLVSMFVVRMLILRVTLGGAGHQPSLLELNRLNLHVDVTSSRILDAAVPKLGRQVCASLWNFSVIIESDTARMTRPRNGS